MKRLLLLERHRLGDAVMSLPFLRGAAEGHEVHVACSAAARPLYELILPPERIVTAEGSPRAWLGALRRLRCAVGVSVWADVRDHLLLRILGIPVRAGFPMDRTNYYASSLPWRARNLRIGRFLQGAARAAGLRPLTLPLRRKAYLQHHVEDWTQLAAALGFAPRLDPPWLGLPAAPLPERAEAFFRAHAGKPVWLLHPGASAETKRWPHFARLVRELFAPRGIPLVLLDPPDSPPVEAGYPECLRWPPGTFAEFVRLAARCDAVLSNDSVASHLGAALGLRVATVFGSGSSAWFAPYTPSATLFESSACPVRPCFERCVQPSVLCLEDVSYERVARGIEALFPS